MQISSLQELHASPDYFHLDRLIANNNHISTLADLCKSPLWTRNQPTEINLQYNDIKEVRTWQSSATRDSPSFGILRIPTSTHA